MGFMTKKKTTNTLFDRNTNTIIRSNEFKLTKNRVESKKYQWFFTNRVINTWNGLPARVVECVSFEGFKRDLDVALGDELYRVL